MVSTTPREVRHDRVGASSQVCHNVNEDRALLVHFGGQLTELSEVAYVSGAAATTAIAKRVYKRLVKAEETVNVWLDTDLLASKGKYLELTNLLNSLLNERTRLGKFTSLTAVTGSSLGDLKVHVDGAALRAYEMLGATSSDKLTLDKADEFHVLRLQNLQEDLQDETLTEELLFEWKSAIDAGELFGAVQFKVSDKPAGADYILVGVGSDPEMQPELMILRNERCLNSLPFEGVGVALDPWSLAGEEVERKLEERWEDASVCSERRFSPEALSLLIANLDLETPPAFNPRESVRLAPGIEAALKMVEEGSPVLSRSDASNAYSFDMLS